MLRLLRTVLGFVRTEQGRIGTGGRKENSSRAGSVNLCEEPAGSPVIKKEFYLANIGPKKYLTLLFRMFKFLYSYHFFFFYNTTMKFTQGWSTGLLKEFCLGTIGSLKKKISQQITPLNCRDIDVSVSVYFL